MKSRAGAGTSSGLNTGRSKMPSPRIVPAGAVGSTPSAPPVFAPTHTAVPSVLMAQKPASPPAVPYPVSPTTGPPVSRASAMHGGGVSPPPYKDTPSVVSPAAAGSGPQHWTVASSNKAHMVLL